MNPSERQRLLQRVVVGELNRDDALVAEQARSDPQFARELDEMLSVVGALERDGVLTQARATTATETSERPRPAPARRKRLLWAVALAAAAAVAVLVARPWRSGGSTPSEDPFLGPGGVRCEQPIGLDPGRFELFRWSAPATAVRAEIEVFDSNGMRVGGDHDLKTNEWRPPAAQLATWPATIEWQVDVYDSTGKLLGSQSAEASRGP